MSSILFRAGFVACGIALFLVCSCEKHHVGEMPEVQREQVDLASGPKEVPPAAEERSASPVPPAKSTPAEFFPESTPP